MRWEPMLSPPALGSNTLGRRRLAERDERLQDDRLRDDADHLIAQPAAGGAANRSHTRVPPRDRHDLARPGGAHLLVLTKRGLNGRAIGCVLKHLAECDCILE